MISIEAYKENPCRISSLPYWKAKSLTIPASMLIIHDHTFDETLLDHYLDRKFFRLLHRLSSIPEFHPAGIRLEVIPSDRYPELTDMINRSYAHSGIRVSLEDVHRWTTTQVYCPELWIGAILNEKLVGSILCDLDRETGEGIIEWLQVLPEYRGRSIASALIGQALKVMKSFADFATVSGACDNITNPECVYRHCGFEGEDVWHILQQKVPTGLCEAITGSDAK